MFTLTVSRGRDVATLHDLDHIGTLAALHMRDVELPSALLAGLFDGEPIHYGEYVLTCSMSEGPFTVSSGKPDVSDSRDFIAAHIEAAAKGGLVRGCVFASCSQSAFSSWDRLAEHYDQHHRNDGQWGMSDNETRSLDKYLDARKQEALTLVVERDDLPAETYSGLTPMTLSEKLREQGCVLSDEQYGRLLKGEEVALTKVTLWLEPAVERTTTA